MPVNFDITTYIANRGFPPPVIHVSQGDTDWAYRIKVMATGAVYAPNVTYAILTGHKPDGHVFAYRGSKSGDYYVFTPSNANGNLAQMTTTPGDVPCELRLINSSRSIGTANFILRVEPGPEGVVTVASASALPAYTTILQELGVLIGKVETLPDDVPGWIGDWLAAHISNGTAVDDTFTVSGAAADAKLTGDRLTALEGGKLSIDGSDELTVQQAAAIRSAIGAEAAGQGVTDDVKNAILACFQAVEWIGPEGAEAYAALREAMFPGSGGSELPETYQQVEYIATEGSSYFATGVGVPIGAAVTVKAQALAKPSAVSNAAGNNEGTLFRSYCCFSAATANYVGVYYGNVNCFVQLPNLYASPTTITSVFGAGTISVEASNVAGSASNSASASAPAITNLQVGHTGDAGGKFIGRIYGVTVKNNLTELLKLIPCYRKADGTVGMYDTVNHRFYGSESTAFTKGPNVEEVAA